MQVYTFNTISAENITLYAKWNPNVYIMTYVLNDGSSNLVVTDYAGSELLIPTRDGYTFNGWYVEIDLTLLYGESTFPTSDTT